MALQVDQLLSSCIRVVINEVYTSAEAEDHYHALMNVTLARYLAGITKPVDVYTPPAFRSHMYQFRLAILLKQLQRTHGRISGYQFWYTIRMIFIICWEIRRNLPATDAAIARHPKEPRNHAQITLAGPPNNIGVFMVDAIDAAQLKENINPCRCLSKH